MPTTDNRWIPLARAAQRLGMSWHRCWKHVLDGSLEGDKRDGRWYVRVASVERYAQHGDRRVSLAEALHVLVGGE